MNTKKRIFTLSAVVVILLIGGIILIEKEKFIPQQVLDSQNQNTEIKSTKNTDMQHWNIYKDSKYGFTFQLPDEYAIPKNNNNFTRDSHKGPLILKNDRKEFIFYSKKGQDIITDAIGKGDAVDVWEVSIKVYPFSFQEENFRKWISQNSSVDIENVGQKQLSNGNLVSYVSWASICDDYSAFFKRDTFVVELNTCGSNFFADGKEDYFSAILNSVTFTK